MRANCSVFSPPFPLKTEGRIAESFPRNEKNLREVKVNVINNSEYLCYAKKISSMQKITHRLSYYIIHKGGQGCIA